MTEPSIDPVLVDEIYQDLRRRARRLLARGGASVAPTSLVHEAVEKLYKHDPTRWVDETHFKATASRAMRQILLDRAKARHRHKRAGDAEHVSLTGVPADHDPLDSFALHHALEKLEQERPRCGDVVRLRLLGGLEFEEIATHLGVSLSTAKREWRVGRSFLAAASR